MINLTEKFFEFAKARSGFDGGCGCEHDDCDHDDCGCGHDHDDCGCGHAPNESLGADFYEDPAAYVERLHEEWLDSYDGEIGATPRQYVDSLSQKHAVAEYAEAALKRGWMLDEAVIEALAVPEYIEFLNIMLDSDNAEAADIAASALAAIGGGEVEDIFIEALAEDSLSGEAQLIAYDFLSESGEGVVDKILKVIYAAAPDVQGMLVEIMSNYKGRKEVYMWLVSMLYRAEDVALYASLLGAYGNPDAISILKEFAEEPDIDYNEFMEIRNAVERLGGELETKRDFSCDELYKIIKGGEGDAAADEQN